VIFGRPVMKGLYDKLGVNMPSMKRGQEADLFSTYDVLRPEQRALLQEMIDTTYYQFVSKAAAGRHQDFAKLEANAQGRVWSGSAAKDLGLVDTLGGFLDALAWTKQLCGIPATEEVCLMVLPEPKSFWEEFSAGLEMTLREHLFTSEELAFLNTISAFRAVETGGMLAYFPYQVEIH